MSQPFTMARQLTPGQYFAAVDGWNIAHETEDEEDTLEPPSVDWWEKQQQRIANNPHLTN